MTQHLFAYRKAPELSSGTPKRYRVATIGAGPVGLAAAIDLAQHGVEDCLLLDEEAALAEGSRAICFAQRTLQILDRLGCSERAVADGIVWNSGKVFLGDRLLYQFDLLPEEGHKHPAFINLPQYRLEHILIERLLETHLDARWRNRVVGIKPSDAEVILEIDTPDGRYEARCDYVIVADGARSPVRRMLGLESEGRIFRDRFLIADIRMAADFPAERRFWFNPTFHPEQSALMHRQSETTWRIDLQLGWDADPELERQPERATARIRAMLGPQYPFSVEWISVYTFQCRSLRKFRHGRVLFAGDAAHQMSPFGARGANSGVQDADNLVWKLALVVTGNAPDSLLDTYDAERVPAAEENLLHSTRSTDFITPKSRMSRAFRDATLHLAQTHPFARRLVNSGRLSTPHVYARTPLSTPDRDEFTSRIQPGAAAIDAPLRSAQGDTWLIDQLGQRSTCVYFAGTQAPTDATVARIRAADDSSAPVQPLIVCAPGRAGSWATTGIDAFEDARGLFAQRYDAAPGSTYLIRPDQHLAARWRELVPPALRAAVRRATGHG